MGVRDRKIAGELDRIAGWTPAEIDELELKFLHKMFECKEADGVDVTLTYAKYMSQVQMDADNYPVFMKILQIENHWVVDALIGAKDPVEFFKVVQPNTFILDQCFRMLRYWRPGSIYFKNLLLLFGILRRAYENPYEGYRIFPADVTDINNLGKHLDKAKPQTDPVNRTVLEILDRIAALNDAGGLKATDEKILDVATQANNIRGKFLDMTKALHEAIPAELLKREDYKTNEITPGITVKETQDSGTRNKAKN